MADTIFEFVAEKLEASTDLDKLEARGTVRLALKSAGLEARSVTKEQMVVLLQKVLPGELSARGVDAAQTMCDQLVGALKDFEAGGGSGSESPEDVFRRLGG
jgi:hypothetical protein